MKLGHNVCLNDILDKSENASHQLGQILKKLCVCSRGHLLCPILLKVGPNSLKIKLNKKLGQQVKSLGHIFSPLFLKVGHDVFFMISDLSLEMGHVWSKIRSLGQIY